MYFHVVIEMSDYKLTFDPMQPKVVTDMEDEELRTRMEELRRANEEVAGDDDTSDQEGITVEESEEAAP